MKLDFISYIWDDDCIQRLDENKWQCFWCNNIFQVINATKVLDRVLVTKGVYIKSCYASMDKYPLTIYQELQHFKAARKVAIKDYSENIKSSISILQNKSSTSIESTIHHSYKSITS